MNQAVPTTTGAVTTELPAVRSDHGSTTGMARAVNASDLDPHVRIDQQHDGQMFSIPPASLRAASSRRIS